MVSDVLMVIVADNQGAKLAAERKGRSVYRGRQWPDRLWNIFERLLEIAERGQVFLTDEQVAVLKSGRRRLPSGLDQ